ncbi:MAG: DEAD/DEAH box helicase family protein [Lamprobacter sp.]|uniref:DEAD/DEAH box helicase family protein n=1 Tax=Lamprobacter sp. TaxID=3100796 RepID=UPI002B2577C1|nr:DEAD/DEAH box helicase family protein [Lamprobacter sp.]MEA3642661.1 DEAD/DEAH box helicase family protein [Lamprobacter sp.]
MTTTANDKDNSERRGASVSQRAARASQAEDDFVALFADVFGLEKTQLLAPEFPFLDIDGTPRYIDFALRAAQRKIAFEVDGPTHYQPPDFDRNKYEDDLRRQNSLIYQGWQVYRWTDHELERQRDRVKEQLALFLERLPGLLELDDFLPRQQGAAIDLRAHQQDAHDWLALIRAEGKTIALLEHATGSGKTVTAIEDAKRVGGPVLYVAHRKNLVHQTGREFARLWPDVDHGRIEGGRWQPDCHVVCASVQALANRLDEIAPDRFRYLIIDEAHHAAADSYRALLAHFKPAFTLGLTATPERPDGKPVLELFRDAAHRLSLKDAIERGELVPIRCVRVKTNIDLSRVRFNEVQYNRQDLETTITVPARNELIVRTYLEHVRGRKGVTFCVNIRHGDALADLYRQHGVPARSVSGGMPARERDEALAAFARGELHMLCACDLLNEGWDCPDIEVLLMARPTLSKIIYMQQLGRGTRKAPSKESLLVFDFVDNAGRYNQSWDLHRLTRTRTYGPGRFVLAPKDRIADENANGPGDPLVLNLGLWSERMEEIDIFDWQNVVKDMLTVAELELALAASENYLRGKVLAGELTADHDLSIGSRRYFYFGKDRKQEIAERFGLQPVTAANIRERFVGFCEEMDMAASYKPVLLLSLLETVGDDGSTPINLLTLAFRDFYLKRKAEGLRVEKPRARMARVEELTETDIQRLILEMPFRKFAQRGFLRYDRDASRVRFAPMLWTRLADEADLAQLRALAEDAIAAYYARVKPDNGSPEPRTAL